MNNEKEIHEARHFTKQLAAIYTLGPQNPFMRRVIHQYSRRAHIFARVYFQQGLALANESEFNHDFAWHLLKQIAEDLYTLETYLFGPLPETLTADLECLLMICNKSPKGRRPTERRRYLRLADRHQAGESWMQIKRDVGGKFDLKESIRSEPRRAERYIEAVSGKTGDYDDLAYVEERLFADE